MIKTISLFSTMPRRGLLASLGLLGLAACSVPNEPADRRFELGFTGSAPQGIVCNAENPAGQVEVTTGIFGRPYIKLMDHAEQGTIRCNMPDGARYLVVANKAAATYQMRPDVIAHVGYHRRDAGGATLKGNIKTRNGVYETQNVPIMVREN